MEKQTLVMLTKKDKYFEVFHWVNMARLDWKTNRYELEYVVQDDTGLVATDGRRMHYAKGLHILDNGFYRPLRINTKEAWLIYVEDAGKYPNYHDIFPNIKEIKPIHVKWISENFFEKFLYTMIRKTKGCWNTQYLKEALSFQFENEILIYEKSREYPLYFTTLYRDIEICSIIMPINMEVE